MAIAYSQVQVEIREVVLKEKPTSLLAYSEKATVPVLITSEKHVIDESRDIMDWALKQSDEQDWLLLTQPDLQAQIKLLIDENDNEFKLLLDKYKYADRYPEFTESQHRERAQHYLSQLELLLNLNNNLVGSEVSIADIAIFPFIRQFAAVDAVWFAQAPYPLLRKWLDRHVDSALFKTAMKKYPQWIAGDKPQYFPADNKKPD